MCKKFFFAILNILFVISNNQVLCNINVHVDERFELTSIAFRLTGEPVFAQKQPEAYVIEINNYFEKYKNHELVIFIEKQISTKQAFHFNLITDLAADIQILSDTIVISNKWITYFELNDTCRNQEDWTQAELYEYLRLLNKFYHDTYFHSFYKAHQDFYNLIEKEFQDIVNQINTAWFVDFFGKPFEMENIWLVPANGKHNFSLQRRDNNGKVYNNCAIGCSDVDSTGIPVFDHESLRILIHEICHNYVNPICDAYKEVFASICDTLYFHVEYMLKTSYYDDVDNVLYEGVNRMCEFAYYSDQNIFSQEDLLQLIILEERKGFIWLEESLKLMNVFLRRHDKSQFFSDFMPVVKGFYHQVAADMIDYYLPKFKLRYPRVVATIPAKNAVVDTTISEIVIIFSQPMFTGFFWPSEFTNIDGVVSIPGDFDRIMWRDPYTYVVPLQKPLNPHTKYGYNVSSYFPNAKHFLSVDPYDLIFETK